MWTIFKVFIEFVTILLLFYAFAGFFGHEACGIPAPQPRIKHVPPALEGEVLTTGLPGKSQKTVSLRSKHTFTFVVFVQSLSRV